LPGAVDKLPSIVPNDFDAALISDIASDAGRMVCARILHATGIAG